MGQINQGQQVEDEVKSTSEPEPESTQSEKSTQQVDMSQQTEESIKQVDCRQINDNIDQGDRSQYTGDSIKQVDRSEQAADSIKQVDKSEQIGESTIEHEPKLEDKANPEVPVAEEVSSTDPERPKSRPSNRRLSYENRRYSGSFQNYGLAYLPYKSNFEPSEAARLRAEEFMKAMKL